jgi:hypothetical protein
MCLVLAIFSLVAHPRTAHGANETSDACGAYGFPQLTISHFGRTEPRGEIVLVADHGPVKIRSGMLLLVQIKRSCDV